jgi:two-component sensor histidine kinase
MATLLVPHHATSAARVRQAMLADLASRSIGDDSADEVVLVASELVGNAIRHTPTSSSGELTVSWQLGRRAVTVQVSDASRTGPVPRHAADDEPGGRGLAIVDALAEDWGYDAHSSGKHVWARVPVRAPGR